MKQVTITTLKCPCGYTQDFGTIGDICQSCQGQALVAENDEAKKIKVTFLEKGDKLVYESEDEVEYLVDTAKAKKIEDKLKAKKIDITKAIII